VIYDVFEVKVIGKQNTWIEKFEITSLSWSVTFLFYS